MKRLIAAALIATLPAGAMAFDQNDRAAVEATVNNFASAYTSGDYDRIVQILPPKLVDYMADQMGGMTGAELKQTMAKQMGIFMSDIKIDAFSMNVRQMKTGDTSDGTPYAFIPTVTKITPPEQSQKTLRSQTLVFQDGDGWYLVRIEADQQYNMVKAVYPGFEGVRLP